VTDSNGENGARDAQGRFRTGNAGGPGNPKVRQLAAHQAAVREALTPDDLRAVIRKLHELAIDGDVSAARVVLDRVVGKSKHEVAGPPAWTFEAQAMGTARGRAAAIRSLLGAVVEGRVPPEDAKALVDLIQAAGSVLPHEILEQLGLA